MARPRTTSVQPVAAVERSLQVLNTFRAGHASQSLADVVARSGLLKSTVFRILLTLENNGYLVKLADGTYQLGAVFLQLGAIYRRVFDVEKIVTPVLRELVDLSGESATFYVREGEHRVCLSRIESPHPVRDIVPVGAMLPMDKTACANVFRTHADSRWEDIRDRADKHIKFSIGAGNPHAAAIAAPVFSMHGLAGVMTLTGPRERFTPKAVDAMRGYLQDAMRTLAKPLGAAPD